MISGERFSIGTALTEKLSTMIQLTYRYGFEAIVRDPNGPSPLAFIGSSVVKGIFNIPEFDYFTSDVGWGCMIRTSQSLLANALLRSGVPFEEAATLFGDTKSAKFSLHNFVKVAQQSPLQVKPGQWFGPNAASLSISRLCDGPIMVILAESGDIPPLQSYPALVLMPVRLGIDSINKYYHESLFHLLSCPQSVGIAGGKPSASFYFFGYQDQDLVYFDPHSPQPAIRESDFTTYRPRTYQRSHVDTLDPSMMIGMLFTSADEFSQFKQACKEKGNKIVHFSTKSANCSDFVHVQHEVDEFVDLAGDHGEDFVDLGGERSEEVVIVNEEETPSLVSSDEYEAINLSVKNSN